jgi:transcriptional repressor NrdR
MKCPFCGNKETSVKDSRAYDDGDEIKRRRACSACGAKFTTVERIFRKEILVIKKDRKKVLFNKDKLIFSITASAGKRINPNKIKDIANDITKRLENSGITEVKSSVIGEMIMEQLERIDKISFIRFASVYMNFETANDFSTFIKRIES